MSVKFTFAVLLISIGLFNCCLASCLWYDQCGQNPEVKDREAKVNCLYHGEPKPFATEEGYKKFQVNCKDFDQGRDTKTCCSDAQIITLDGQISPAQQVLLRCPSCLRNFMKLWCHFTCSANQSEFMSANKTRPFKLNGTDVTQVVAVDYSVSNAFANGLMDSARHVKSPSSNSPALALLCGPGGADCKVQQWLDFMGDINNGQDPFTINFHITDKELTFNTTTIKPMNESTFLCNEAPDKDSPPCSCPDCPASCAPIPPPPPPTKPCEIMHIDCYDFAFTVAFATFLLIFGCYCICYNICVQDSLRLEVPGEADDAGCCGFKLGAAANRNIRKRERLDSVRSEHLGKCESAGALIESFLERSFRRWGLMCTRHPAKVITVVLVISGILCAGASLFQVTTNPVELWSGPGSRARMEKNYFDSHFVPFYRTEQLIITRPHNHTVIKHQPIGFIGPVTNYTSLFDKTFLHEMLDLQLAIEDLSAEHEGKNITLRDICFAPLSPDNNNCTIQSVFNYFQNRHDHLDKTAEPVPFTEYDYLDHIDSCTTSPVSTNDTTYGLGMSCLGTFGGPVFPWVALGGYEGSQYNTSQALVITFVVNNHLDEDKNAAAEAWESEFISFMKNYTKNNPNVTIAFSSERSIEDEIERESSSDVFTILGSYLIMFAYIAIMLGRYVSVDRILVDSKMVLGLSGVLIVLLSVGASLGFYSYLGIPSTLIIVEVVPFLVLAVGVDNIFILVQTYQREKRQEGETTADLVARVVGKVGPSMLLTSASESMAFFLGALTDMPAVKVFSLYAAMAVLIDFLLQITIFISLLYLDARREEANRLDCCCMVKSRAPKETDESNGILFTLMNDYYSHFLLKEYVRPLVMIFFVGYFCLCGAMTSRINIGLDQSLSMPTDSYVLDYFHDLQHYLSVGPPVYFVVRDGHDYSTVDGQNDVCGVAGCEQSSVVQQINSGALLPNSSYIAQPTSSWLDDYFAWLVVNPCCREYEDGGGFCPSTETNKTCNACNVSRSIRPTGDVFNKYLPWFLKDNPNTKCAKGGHAAYGSAVQLHNTSHHETTVGATYFMTYHSILKTSADYINALKEARSIADNITLSMNGTGEVFPYSVFYVFYEQYLTIEKDSLLNIIYCLAAIFVISFLLLGLDLYSAVMVVITIIMIIVDIMGHMYLWDIDLNALSLVNLIMAIGISVEFCSHIIRAFAVSVLPTRKERAKEALGHMGSSVLSGITLTKAGGVMFLALSKSQLFQVFYFRMYLLMVIWGAAHGLIFLPVFLSYVGPPVNKAKVFMERVQKEMLEDTASRSEQQGINGQPAQRYVYDNPPSYNQLNEDRAVPL